MRKIDTMYPRDESKRGHPVMPPVKPQCAWVEAGEGLATMKLDGTNVKIENGQLLKRQKPKDRDYDDAAYVAADRQADRWLFEGFDALQDKADGIYEALGPRIQGNTCGYPSHILVSVVPPQRSLMIGSVPRDFDALRSWLGEHEYEGVVFHHPDGRMAKIKRRDFGFSWPVRP